MCVFPCPVFAHRVSEQWVPVVGRRKGKTGIRTGVRFVTLPFIFKPHDYLSIKKCLFVKVNENRKMVRN